MAAGKIGQMFQHIDGYDPVEIAVGEIQPLLAIADVGLNLGTVLPQPPRHVLARFQRHVMALLFLRQLFIFEMFPQPRADFQGADKVRRTMAHDILVAEAVRHRITVGENIMPMLHEIIANALVFGRKRGKLFGPLAHIDTPLSQKKDWKGKFNPPRFLRRGARLILKHCSLHA